MDRDAAHARVVAACSAWAWTPPDAARVEQPGSLVALFPAWQAQRLQVLRLGRTPGDHRPVGALLDDALATARRVRGRAGAADRGRAYAATSVLVWVTLEAPVGLEDELRDRGGVVDEELDVLARPVGVDDPVPEGVDPALAVRPVLDRATLADACRVADVAFGDGMPSEDELDRMADDELGAGADGADGLPRDLAGTGWRVLALLDGEPVGSAGASVVDGVCRLWGGAVVPSARGRGAYRAMVHARTLQAAGLGADLALVKARTGTSGPILRGMGFTAHGQVRSYVLPLPD